MEGPLKAKVTARLPADGARPRPASPTKSQPSTLSPAVVRPRAKVTSTATILTRKPNGAPSNVATTSKPTPTAAPRAPSPFKIAQSRSSQDAPSPGVGAPQVRARLTARTNGARSASPQPEPRQRALTATPSEASAGRPRRQSVSSLHAKSPSQSDLRGASIPPSPSKSALSSTDDNRSSVGSTTGSAVNGVVRIKSKVSRVVELGQGQSSGPSLSPPSPLLRSRPARVPSISGLLPLSPISPTDDPTSPPLSATSGHQRFATTRETSPTQRSHPFQPFSSNDDLIVRYSAASARGGPPFEPQSPPTSTLSFSSRSSASQSSASYETQNTDISRSTAPTLNPRLNGNQRVRAALTRANYDGSSPHIDRAPSEPTSPTSPSDGYYDDRDTDEHIIEDPPEDIDPERKLKAEAKSNRKIADLEITNRSLLAINSSLEATKHKQAREIRDLKRRLRESRLVLPPPAFRAAQADEPDADDADDSADDSDDAALLEGADDE
ncbi:hypothetical protein OBBRIDRAFT_890344, partial [Obba rivulosa]